MSIAGGGRRTAVFGDFLGVLSFGASAGEAVAQKLDASGDAPVTARRAILPYTRRQAALVEEHIANIQKDAESLAKRTVEPTLAKRAQILQVIKDYLRKAKRKVYGGIAINEFIRAKDPADAFYDESADVPDIDFYTPYPVQDIKAICDALKAAGVSNVDAREAQHIETYKINANYWSCCDVSYVQSAVYRKIPTKEMPDGLLYVHPSFMFIDFLRILNDPLMSYFRLDKAFPRFSKLHQHYPLEGPARVVDVHRAAREVFGTPENYPEKARIIRRTVLDLLASSESAIMIGLGAYNTLMDLAGSRRHPGSGRDGRNNAIVMELLTVDFAQDVGHLYRAISRDVPDVKYVEFHPFYDFLGHRCHFVLPRRRAGASEGADVDDVIVLRVFDNKHKCMPFMEVPMAVPGEARTATVRVGTFTVIVMFLMIMRFRVRVEDRGKKVDALAVAMYDNMMANLYDARDEFFARSGKSVLDNTPFKEFVLPCIGEAMHALRINQMVQDARYQRYRQRGLRYNPDKDKDLRAEDYQFSNTSGNVINAPKDRLFDPAPAAASEVPSTSASTSEAPKSRAAPSRSQTPIVDDAVKTPQRQKSSSGV